ncbi:hypothetical protein GO984_09980 [Rhodobacteraceae bacterium CY05]|uniref:Fatty acid desaturase domain-containing protein n=2 Tax=Parasedimentitalea huanghaiensis TaxID=2682100 RepID=A0A6L6WFS3_9RHOB|nr:hypothetical protein [Zongyanglinia huanghaiensis]
MLQKTRPKSPNNKDRELLLQNEASVSAARARLRPRAVVKRTRATSDGAFPLADLLSIALVLAHFALLLIKMPVGLSMGQVSHPNAHELIHHPLRRMRRLGSLIYTTMLIGHHVSAHLRVHHPQVATRDDPNTARRGEEVYCFLLRAWLGSFRAGLRADDRLPTRKSVPATAWSHPYVGYCGGASFALILATVAGGAPLLLLYLLLTGYAQLQIFPVDCVQHYGLQSAMTGSGRVEPVGPGHSWNAPHWYSSAMMLNAPRHSDHHLPLNGATRN